MILVIAGALQKFDFFNKLLCIVEIRCIRAAMLVYVLLCKHRIRQAWPPDREFQLNVKF